MIAIPETIFCDPESDRCVHLAVQDLASDIGRIRGRMPDVHSALPREEDGVILVGDIRSPGFRRRAEAYGVQLSSLEGLQEGYRLQSFGDRDQNILLCGSDERGAMWAVYEFAEKFLGVDPLGFWTDHQPPSRTHLDQSEIFVEDAPQNFTYRGWFINDEDLLSEWKDGGGKRNIDYRFYRQIIHPDVYSKVLEAALRLKQNLIIPASFLDIENPAEEEMVRLAVERGFFVSQHHIETLGVNHFALEKYWKSRGCETIPSFVSDRGKMIETWTHYVRKWARFGDRVIWQLGLRGRGDRPVWNDDPNIPQTDEARGALISEAMDCQRRIVVEVTGNPEPVFTTTLWGEGTALHEKGHLNFPEKTIVVFADTRTVNVGGGDYFAHQWAEDFYSVQRRPKLRYGIYYHVAVWIAGPHLVQGVPPAKIQTCFDQAIAGGAAIYAITNVANLREVVLGARAVAQLTHHAATFDHESFLRQWCASQFGAAERDVFSIYQDWERAYVAMDSGGTAHPALLHDGALSWIATTWLQRFCLDAGCPMEDRMLRRGKGLPKEILHTPSAEVVEEEIRFLLPRIATSLLRWQNLETEIRRVAPSVPAARRTFYDHHFQVQAAIMTGITAWALGVGRAFLASRENSRMEEAILSLNDAARALCHLLNIRDASATGKWEGWYRGDHKMDLPVLHAYTGRLHDCLKHKTENAPL